MSSFICYVIRIIIIQYHSVSETLLITFFLYSDFLTPLSLQSAIIPGPPFLFGACSVLLALLVALFIPEHTQMGSRAGSWKKHASAHGHQHSTQPPEAKEPLLQDTNV